MFLKQKIYGNLLVKKRWSNWCTRAPPRLYLVPGLTLLGAPPTFFHGTRQATQALERVAAAVFVNSTKLWVPHSVPQMVNLCEFTDNKKTLFHDSQDGPATDPLSDPRRATRFHRHIQQNLRTLGSSKNI